MSLNATLQIGKTALAANQAALRTVGNNIAGAADPNYTRQAARIEAAPGQQLQPGIFVGGGVSLTGVERQIDNALMQRLRGGIADGQGAAATAQWLDRVESIFNELSDGDLSTAMSQFFASWSNLANKPTDIPLRQNVIAQGQTLAHKLSDMRRGLDELAGDNGARLAQFTQAADDLADRIADLNTQITAAEHGNGPAANNLRDRRDELLGELATYVNIHTIDQPDGSINVYVGSEPLVMGGRSNGISLEQSVMDGEARFTPRFTDNGAPLNARSGSIGGTIEARRHIDETRDGLDAIAAGLIFELNKLHSSGQGLVGYGSVTASNAVDDAAAALDTDAAGLAFQPNNGSFIVTLRDRATGRSTKTLIDVNLDGTPGGTTLSDLAADLDAIAGISASVTGGKLTISADSEGQEIVFAEDSSGILAALGVGGFFTGESAEDIAVSETLDDPRRLAVSRNGQPADNGTAKLIAAMQETPLASLNGTTLNQTYEALVFNIAASTQAAHTDAEAAQAVTETLQTQRQAISGVSMDEEAVTLMRYQRSYQGAARLIAAVDEMMQTVLQLV